MTSRPDDSPTDQLLDYLRRLAALRATMRRADYVYAGIEDFVLAEGRTWPPHPLPRHIKRGAARQCFLNAYKAAQRHRELRYVEGYALAMIPVLHAWCVDSEDRVVEVTWEEPGAAYVGVAFTLAEVRALHQHSDYVSMLDDWDRGYPLLRGLRGGALSTPTRRRS